MAPQKTILVTVDYYLPGFKGGGPLRSIHHLAAALREEFRFRIVTNDRDFKDSSPYAAVRIGEWNNIENSQVFYIPSAGWSLRNWKKILSTTGYDVLYLNSFFSPQFTIVPLLLRRLGLVRETPVIVAPRGEFSKGALSLKRWKKMAYLCFARAAGMYAGVLWHSSSEFEKEDIQAAMGSKVNIHVAMQVAEGNAPEPIWDDNRERKGIKKTPGSLRLVFLSRLTRMKNLDGALRMLMGIEGEIDFDIYGPTDDQHYWETCQEIAQGLPKNIHMRYLGAVPHERVREILSKYHFLFLPTHGENFGHVIHEALSAGLPVILSDRTPWRGLSEMGVGWDLPFSATDEICAVLRRCVAMDEEEHGTMSRRAFRFAREEGPTRGALERNRELFRKAVDVQ